MLQVLQLKIKTLQDKEVKLYISNEHLQPGVKNRVIGGKGRGWV